MSAYKLDDERAIRTGRLAHDWMKSGLLTPAQYERIKPELQVDLRRTNLFLRLVLFVFAMLILQSGFGLVAIFVDIRRETPTAILCAVAAVASFWLAGYLVQRYRLYRFGIEEAAAVAAILLMGASAAAGWSGAMGGSFDVAIAAGLVGAAAVAVAVFIRFGYLYAALAAIACITALPFLFGDSEIIHRLAAIAILSVVAAVAWVKRDEYGADHPGDTTEWIEAAAWVGIYCLINLQIFTKIDRASWFHWATYAGIWIVPPVAVDSRPAPAAARCQRADPAGHANVEQGLPRQRAIPVGSDRVRAAVDGRRDRDQAVAGRRRERRARRLHGRAHPCVRPKQDRRGRDGGVARAPGNTGAAAGRGGGPDRRRRTRGRGGLEWIVLKGRTVLNLKF
jgi:hypothetical protein